MQIRSDYPSFQKQSYEQSYTYHVSPNLHDVQSDTKNRATETDEKNGMEGRKRQRQDAMEFSQMIQEANRKPEKKSGLSGLRGFWDGLAQEEDESATESFPIIKEKVLSHIRSIFKGAQGIFQTWNIPGLVRKLTAIPSVVKTGISTALKRFGRGTEDFTALSEEGMQFGKRQAGTRKEEQKEQMGDRKKHAGNLQESHNHHLMDSYSKTGAYCKINQNLTYQKPGAAEQKLQKQGAEQEKHTE